MTEQTTTDFDGCHSACRAKGVHTLIWGGCEHAPEPEPTVSLPRTYTAADRLPAIGFDTYTVPQLAELLEPALRRVTVRLGPNARAMLERGEPVRLSGGEYADLAREAAHTLVHRNDPPAGPGTGGTPEPCDDCIRGKHGPNAHRQGMRPAPTWTGETCACCSGGPMIPQTGNRTPAGRALCIPCANGTCGCEQQTPQRTQAATSRIRSAPTADWTPPPPGDTREQLPDHLLQLIRPYLRGYTSTACQTAAYLTQAVLDHPEHLDELCDWKERMQARCRRNQKYTGEICPHHQPPEPRPAATRAGGPSTGHPPGCWYDAEAAEHAMLEERSEGQSTAAPAVEAEQHEYINAVECAISLTLDCGGTPGVHRVRDAVLAVRDQEMDRLRTEVQRLGDWSRTVSDRATAAETARDRYHDELAVNEKDRVATLHRANQYATLLAEAHQIISVQKDLIGAERRIVATALDHRDQQHVKAGACPGCGRDHMTELQTEIAAADDAYQQLFPPTTSGPARPGRIPDDAVRTPRQRAYEAVNAYLESLGGRLPTTKAARTAQAWLVANTALDAALDGAGHAAVLLEADTSRTPTPTDTPLPSTMAVREARERRYDEAVEAAMPAEGCTKATRGFVGLDISDRCQAVADAELHEQQERSDAEHRQTGQTIAAVTTLYERWLKDGPPPLGTFISRWWDTRLAELGLALRPAASTPGCTPAAGGGER